MSSQPRRRADLRGIRPPQVGPAPARLEWVDAARGLAIVLVVLVHSRDWLSVAGLDLNAWDRVNEVLSGLRMPLFFAISGLLGADWVTARWSALVQVKVTFLAWVYLAWQPIGLLAAVLADRITGGSTTPPHLVMALAASTVRPRSELWFLWALLLYFVLARAGARIPAAVQLIVSGLVSAFWMSDYAPDGNLAWNGAIKFYPFFLIGAHHRRLILWFADRVRSRWWVSLPALLVWAAAAVALTGCRWGRFIGPNLGVRLLGLVAGVALAVRLAGWRPLRYLGARTLPIYLAHTPVIIAVACLVHLVHTSTWTIELAPALPLLVTALVVPATLGMHVVLSATPARSLYAPPALVTGSVRRIGHRPRGAHRR